MSETKTKEETQAAGLSEEKADRLEKQLSNRSVKALSIVLSGEIELLSRKGAKVYSQNGGGTYHVTGNFCTCPDLQEFLEKFLHTRNFVTKFRDFQYREGNVCKHMRAYRIMKSLQKADKNSNLDG